jgi:Yip1 domain
MNPENASVVEPQPTGMGELSRITGVLFEPKKTFTDIGQRPSWLVPMILLILVSIAAIVTISQRVGWERVIRQQTEGSARLQQLTPEQREQNMALQMKIAPAIGYVAAILGAPIYCIIVAAVLLGITAIMSAGLRFKQVFSVVAWSGLPRVIAAILTVVVVFLKNPDDFNMKNPLAFNLGAFMDPNSTSKFLYALASQLDLFAIWTILLLATGLKAAAGRKLSFAGALTAVVIPWAVVVIGGATIAGAFS